MELRRFAAAALLVLCREASANDLICGANPATDAYTCVRLSELREGGDVRSAPMYSGGPINVDRTGFTVHVNCRTDMVELRDRNGVKFGGGHSSSTPQLYQLGARVCTATLPARRSKR